MPLSAERLAKWNRWRVISCSEPRVAVMVASEPSASSREMAAQSSTSMSFTRVVTRANTFVGGPAM